MHLKHSRLEIRLGPAVAVAKSFNDASIRKTDIAEIPITANPNLANSSVRAEKRVSKLPIYVHELERRGHYEQPVHLAVA